MTPRRVRIVGPGRVGGALAEVFTRIGWLVHDSLGRSDDLCRAAHGTDLLVIATPDRFVASVAAAIEPDPEALVIHVAGALGLEVLASHERRGALHPLVSIPDAETGAARLAGGAWFAIAADSARDLSILEGVVEGLGGHPFAVAEGERVRYHAAAVVASNHLVALMGHLERVAASTGVPLAAFRDLARQTLEGLADRRPSEALTGPVSRGDWATVAGHLEALGAEERATYAALAEAAARLVPSSEAPPAWLRAAAVGRLDPREDSASGKHP